MSAKTVYQCDGPNCSEQRKETNHWFVMTTIPGAVGIYEFEKNAAMPKDEPRLHLCGQACVQKKVEQWLTTGKLE